MFACCIIIALWYHQRLHAHTLEAINAYFESDRMPLDPVSIVLRVPVYVNTSVDRWSFVLLLLFVVCTVSTSQIVELPLKL
jgi:hypothetical protein